MISCSLRYTPSVIHSLVSPILKRHSKIFTRFASRDTTHRPANDHENKSTIVALNISDSISIDKANQIKVTNTYKISDLPADLRKEAILLSLRDRPSCRDKLGDIFIFRKGTVVLWGVPNEIQKQILQDIAPLTLNPCSNDLVQQEREYLKFTNTKSGDRSRLDRDVVQLGEYEDESMRHIDQFAISHAIASSVKLAVWELNLDEYLNSINWVTESMKNGESLRLTRAQVFKKTGEIYQLKHKIICSDLLDLPDVYWDRYYQEVLYLSLISFLNIRKRTAVMNEKLNNCCELLNLLAAHKSDKHHVRLEWMIIMLILIEVIFEIVK